MKPLRLLPLAQYSKYLKPTLIGSLIAIGVVGFGGLGVTLVESMNEEVVLGVFEDIGRADREPFVFSEEVVEEQPVDLGFSVFAPHIGVNAPVYENVDGSNEKNYLPNVMSGVAHYRHMDIGSVVVDGSVPGQGGNVFLFGHSQIPGGSLANYQGVFNNLEELVAGDEIKVYYQGKEYVYRVREGHIIEPTEVEYLTKTETETLTLLSCWPLGLDWKRYVIRADLVSM